MMRYLCQSVLLLLVLSACSADENKQIVAAKTDFDLFCEQLTMVTESADFSSLTSED